MDISGQEPENAEPDDCDEIGWFDLSDLPENIFPPHQKIFRTIAQLKSASVTRTSGYRRRIRNIETVKSNTRQIIWTAASSTREVLSVYSVTVSVSRMRTPTIRMLFLTTKS